MPHWSNWSGSVQCSPVSIHTPDSLESLSSLIEELEGPVRAVGQGHSFSPLLDTSGHLISLERLHGMINVDQETLTAEFWAGTTLHEAARILRAMDLAFHIEGDDSTATLGGAVGTGLHGSGAALGSLSSMVAGLTLVKADGTVEDLDRAENPELFNATRLSFGTMGVIAKVTLAVRKLHNFVQKDWRMTASQCAQSIEQLKDSNRIFEIFWMPQSTELMCRSLNQTYEPAMDEAKAQHAVERAGTFGLSEIKLATDMVSLMPFLSKRFHDRITKRHGGMISSRESHGAYAIPHPNRFNEMEFSVPAERGLDCLLELGKLFRESYKSKVAPLRLRYVAADDIWLSPCYMRSSASVSVRLLADQAHTDIFKACERIFHKHSGRPHWGKCHYLTARDFSFIYPKWVDFLNLRKEVDPKRKFLTPQLMDMFGLDAKARSKRTASDIEPSEASDKST